ncbi:MAG TPA: hypothetical protein VHJ20_04790 [Polyangia bacterium]|nr:hypothetical protein [Polyangia bacterium]
MLRPAADDRVLVEAAARARLELGAAGLTSASVDTAGDAYPARLAFVREDGVATIDLLGTLADGSPLERRVPVPRGAGGDDPALLALRAVEILRGMRLASRRPTPVVAAAPAEIAAETPPPPPPKRPPFRAFAGLAALEGRVVGSGAGVAPSVAAGIAASVVPHVAIELTVAGPFFRDLAPTTAGSAHTREELGLVGVVVEGTLGRTDVRARIATGMHHLVAAYDARGMPPSTPPQTIHVRADQFFWTPFVAAGVGASRAFWRNAGLSIEADAVILQPAIDVVVDGHVVGGAGAPSLLEIVDFWAAFP